MSHQFGNQAEDATGGKVTIPIDWDYIIDNYIKNTNTDVKEETKSASSQR
jgi:hypothetical protein